ncbi:MAG: prepilin-type N-terminal cleavage/methylation domain-containing protein [Candidatus Nitronauta litoralis]|uniref:Prepilin-type N-terminal cleavage/methylation domain-containing protein n=1 Tax=Candidatus Nitronauta litoralis TaxID=2705533 RepID=A0A7T0G229_9BACT|nr:MAG: prepilin-type N-terminal cleavage/methylation domain-containing protein [Candidatus Nitronauta litoralis]
MNNTTRLKSFSEIREAGFTFVEIMVVLVLFLVLGGLTARFFKLTPSIEDINLQKAREGVMFLKSGLGAYSFDLKKPPPSKKDGGLEVLVKAGYLSSVPTDPWGNIYQYDNPGKVSGRSYDLYSLGPDGKISEDDVADWNLYGKVYRGTSRIARKRDRALAKYDPKEKS